MEVQVYLWDGKDYYSTARILGKGEIYLHGSHKVPWLRAAELRGQQVYAVDSNILLAEIRGNDIYMKNAQSEWVKRAVIDVPEVHIWDGSGWNGRYAQAHKVPDGGGWPLLASRETKTRLLGAAAATMLYLGLKPAEWIGEQFWSR